MEEEHLLPPGERLKLWLRMAARLGLALLAVWFVKTLLSPLVSLFLPFLLALLTAWLLNPVVRFFQKKLKLSRPLGSLFSVLLAFGVVGGGLTVLVYFAVQEMMELMGSWQALWAELDRSLQQWNSQTDRLLRQLPDNVSILISRASDQLITWLGKAVPDLLAKVTTAAGDAAMGIPAFLVGLTVFLLGTYFLSADWPRSAHRTNERLTPDGRARLAALKTVTVTAFGGYLRAQLLLSLGVFFLLAIGFVLLRQPYALLLAALLAVLDFIPIVGAGTVMVPWGVVLFFMGEPVRALLLLVLWGAIALFRQIAEPKVLGGQTGLSPIASLVSVYVGMRLWGVAGMILAPVLLLIARNLVASGAADGLIRDARALTKDLTALWRS